MKHYIYAFDGDEIQLTVTLDTLKLLTQALDNDITRASINGRGNALNTSIKREHRAELDAIIDELEGAD